MKAQFFPPSVRTNVEGKFAFWRMWHSLKSGCEAPAWFLSLPCPANVAPFLWSLSTSFPNHEPGGSCASQKLGLRLYVILNRRETDKPFSLFQGTKTEYVRKILHPGLIVEGLQGFFWSDTSDRWHSRRDGSVGELGVLNSFWQTISKLDSLCLWLGSIIIWILQMGKLQLWDVKIFVQGLLTVWGRAEVWSQAIWLQCYVL